MKDKIWAQVKDGKVVNVIVLNDESKIPDLSAGFDYFIRVDEMDPRPDPQWLFDGQTFSKDTE